MSVAGDKELSGRMSRMAAAIMRPGMAGRINWSMYLSSPLSVRTPLYFSMSAVQMVAGKARPATLIKLAATDPQKPKRAAAAVYPVRVAVFNPVPPGRARQNTIKSVSCVGVSQWCRVSTSCSSMACEPVMLPIPSSPVRKKLIKSRRKSSIVG